MSEQIHPAFGAENEVVDARALGERLGSADELTTLSPTACSHQLTKVHSLPALREFLLEARQYTGTLDTEIYTLREPHSIEHLFKVACGLDSITGTPPENFGGYFARAFFFSVETIGTIGYGNIQPNGIAAKSPGNNGIE